MSWRKLENEMSLRMTPQQFYDWREEEMRLEHETISARLAAELAPVRSAFRRMCLEGQNWLCNGRDINPDCAVNIADDGKGGCRIDRIKPIKYGGDNHINNMQVLCKSCDKDKSTMNMKQWRMHHVKQKRASDMLDRLMEDQLQDSQLDY